MKRYMSSLCYQHCTWFLMISHPFTLHKHDMLSEDSTNVCSVFRPLYSYVNIQNTYVYIWNGSWLWLPCAGWAVSSGFHWCPSIWLLASTQQPVQQCYLHYTRLFTAKQIKPHNCTAQSIPGYDQTQGHISNSNSSKGLSCSRNPKPKDPNETECAVKASHTSVITVCFKENVAFMEVNRIRGYSRLCVLTRLWRKGREKTLWNALASQWTLAGDGTKYGMHYGSDTVEDEDTNKHINPP